MNHPFALIIALGFMVSCGGSEPVNRPAPEIPRRQAAPGPGIAQAVVPVTSLADGGPNPKFSILRPYFKEFTKKPVDGKVNIFKNNLAAFTPNVEIEEETKIESDEPRTPLEFYNVDSYKLVLIMSGTSQAKALVIDPREKSYIVQVGTLIGNRMGKVVSISGTQVRIEEPGYPPIIKALETASDEMERELQAVQEY